MTIRNIYEQLPESVLIKHKAYWLVDFAGHKFPGGPFRAIYAAPEGVDALYREVMQHAGGAWDGLKYFRIARIGDPATGDMDLYEYREDGRVHAMPLSRIGDTEHEQHVLDQLAKATRDHTGATLVRRALKAMTPPGGEGLATPDAHELRLGLVLSNFKKRRVSPEKPIFLRIRSVTRGAAGEFAGQTFEVPEGVREQQRDMKTMEKSGVEPSWANMVEANARPLEFVIHNATKMKLFRLRLTVEDETGARSLDFGVHDYYAKNEADALKQARLDCEHCIDKLLDMVKADLGTAGVVQ